MKGLLLALTVLVATAIGQTKTPSPPPLKVRSEMLVSSAWLAEHLNDKDLVVLFIAYDRQSYDAGHIPGARLVMMSDITVTRDGIPSELPPAEQLKTAFERVGVGNRSRIILYGERLGVLAARAYFTLDFMGLGARAALFDGGMEHWKSEGRAVTTETSPVKPGRITVHLQPKLLVETDQLFNLVTGAKAQNMALIDARPPEEFTGEKLSEDVTKAGHIPGANGLYWFDLVASREDPVLLPADELRKKFKQAGARPASPVIIYCRTGMQSSLDYFVAKYLGYEVSMYDGSYYEWSAKELPVEKSGG